MQYCDSPLFCGAQLWSAYLSERRSAVRGLPVNHGSISSLNNTYERALVNMHKMPVIWLEYLEYLVGQRLITRARRTFDRALCSLPITQHDRIWPQYLVRASSRDARTRVVRAQTEFRL